MLAANGWRRFTASIEHKLLIEPFIAFSDNYENYDYLFFLFTIMIISLNVGKSDSRELFFLFQRFFFVHESRGL